MRHRLEGVAVNANGYVRKVMDGVEVDELAELIDDGKMNIALSELDGHWTEVMKLAERYGFISQAYGGVAVITTNGAYLEANGPKELANRLRMNNVEI